MSAKGDKTAKTATILAMIALVLGTVVAPRVGFAIDDEAEGRRRFKRGQELYNEGKYIEAAREFEAGYAVAPRPLFLLNIGQSYRRANKLVEAKRAYETLLRLEPNIPQRAEIESHIKAIDDAIQADNAAPPKPTPPLPAPPTAFPPPATADQGSTRPLPSPRMAPQESTPFTVSSPPPPPPSSSDSVFKKPWFWVVVGAAVAAGITIAVVSLKPDNSCQATLCLTEKQ